MVLNWSVNWSVNWSARAFTTQTSQPLSDSAFASRPRRVAAMALLAGAALSACADGYEQDLEDAEALGQNEAALNKLNHIIIRREAVGGTALPNVPISVRYAPVDWENPQVLDFYGAEGYSAVAATAIGDQTIRADDGRKHPNASYLDDPIELGVQVPDGYSVEVGTCLGTGSCTISNWQPYGRHLAGTGVDSFAPPNTHRTAFTIPGPKADGTGWGPTAGNAIHYLVSFRFTSISPVVKPYPSVIPDESRLHCEKTLVGQGIAAPDKFVANTSTGTTGARNVGVTLGLSSKLSGLGMVLELWAADDSTVKIAPLIQRGAESGLQFSGVAVATAEQSANGVSAGATDYDLPPNHPLTTNYNNGCGAQYGASQWGFETDWTGTTQNGADYPTYAFPTYQAQTQEHWTPNYPAQSNQQNVSPCFADKGRWVDDAKMDVSATRVAAGNGGDQVVRLAVTQSHACYRPRRSVGIGEHRAAWCAAWRAITSWGYV
jgi:hypothetical protein